MSRRKQSNPKPLNKGDCADTTDEMTVERRDSKDLNSNDLTDDTNQPQDSSYTSNDETDTEMGESRPEVCKKIDNNVVHKVMDATESENQKPPDEDRNNSSPELFSNAPKSVDSTRSNSEQSDSKMIVDRESKPDEIKSEAMEESSNDGLSTISSVKQFHADEIIAPTPSNNIPKLRLNALLASDPALKPDAKDLKAIHEESQSKNRIANLPVPQILNKQQGDLEANIPTHTHALNEPVIKPTTAVDMPTRMKVFMCVPCGIGFSSPSTLEAHQAYYCSHRNKDVDEEGSSTGTTEKSASNVSSVAGVGTASGLNSSSTGEPPAKVIKTGKQYACTQCSYSADKKVSLNRHMRMHQTSPAPSSNISNGGVHDETASQVDRYCSDCDIRFNNVKTYRAHKQHYCSSRRTDGQLTPKLEIATNISGKVPSVPGSISPQTRNKTPTPAMVAAAAAAAAVAAASLQPPPQPFLALPTNPIIIIPYSLIRAASLIPGPLTSATSGIVNPESTCFTLDNSALKPLATALNINAINSNASKDAVNQVPLTDSSRTLPTTSNETLLAEKNESRNIDATEPAPLKRKEPNTRDAAPLDLSLRRSPIGAILQRQRVRSSSVFLDSEHQRLDMETLLEAGKENLSIEDSGNITPEQIVCAPSLPNSPSMSPSPKRRTISPRSSGAGSTSSMSPPVNVSTASLAAVAATNMLESLPLRSILPADIALKLSESNIMNPLLAKQNLELALKLSAAAAAVNSSNSSIAGNANTADLAAAVAAANKSSLLGLPVLPGAATAATGSTSSASGQPQIYVKQGVSKCKECNIVFCKYENYLAHKQHYCSARNQETTDTDAKVSSTPPISLGNSPVETAPVAYQQLICAACGIKYTSLDNLRAHQNYYCPKGGGASVAAASAAAMVASSTELGPSPVALPKEKCLKCNTHHEVSLPCPNIPTLQSQQSSSIQGLCSGNQNVYKCPVCDAESATASESRKHMETHGTVKAFRCCICRYKGNTLRGMRTHIRMHFDKKTSELNEEHYMSCILEDENMEIPSASRLNQEQLAQQLAATQKHQHHQLQQAAVAAAVGLQQQQQIFNCDFCNYSSSYKGNVLRHMKLTHPTHATSSPSISPEVTEMDTSDGASLHSSVNGDTVMQSNFNIKTEPVDQVVSAPNLHDNNNSPSPQTPVIAHTAHLATHIKSEPMDIGIETATPIQSSLDGPPPPLNPSPETNSSEANAVVAALNQKYCQTCDISFNYMKTFLAHKQFYCKGKLRRPEADESPSPNASMLPRIQSPNALLMQKNKENLQEAAI